MNCLLELVSEAFKLINDGCFFLDEHLVFVREVGVDHFDVGRVGFDTEVVHDLLQAHPLELITSQTHNCYYSQYSQASTA